MTDLHELGVKDDTEKPRCLLVLRDFRNAIQEIDSYLLTPDANYTDDEIVDFICFAQDQIVLRNRALVKLFYSIAGQIDVVNPSAQSLLEAVPETLLQVCRVGTFGANKYTDHGWLTVEDGINRYLDACARHILQHYIEPIEDEESGLLHLAHAAWNVMAVFELKIRLEGSDD